jgi:hypothetical protein
VINWLEINSERFIISEKFKMCSERTQQYFCFEKNIECLFIKIHFKLKNQIKIYNLNSILKSEFLDFEKIKDGKEKVKEWLFKNSQISIKELWYFMSPNYPDI